MQAFGWADGVVAADLQRFIGVPRHRRHQRLRGVGVLRQRIAGGLQRGAMQPGDRLPPTRELSADLAADPRVVSAAYRTLADEGLVEIRPRAGVFVADSQSCGRDGCHWYGTFTPDGAPQDGASGVRRRDFRTRGEGALRARIAGVMRLPVLLRRRGAPTEIGGVARLDRRTKNLTKRLGPGEIAIIHHGDLDRVSAEALVEAGAAAVVNAVSSVSGRYPNLGPGILLEAGIPFDAGLVGVGRYQEDASRELAHELLSQVDRPTAIFAANDLSAIAVLSVAHDLGIAVPAELSVIGFDDIPEASRHVPALSTVRQPMQRLGEVATRLLLALMNGETPEQTHVRLPTRLVPRATTAPPL